MKRPTIASLKKVTAANLAGLGAERLAEILVSVAETRPDLKRRLRMELAAEQGPEHLISEIDKRLGSLETSRGKITWRQRPAFVRDLDALRGLIAERLAGLDRTAALGRMWPYMATAPAVDRRYRDRDGAVAAVYAHAAADLGRLLAGHDAQLAANVLVEAISSNPYAWAQWLPQTLSSISRPMAEAALRLMSERRRDGPGWLTLVRHLADAADNIDAFRATYTADALENPSVAVELAKRYLAADRVEEAGAILRGAAPKPSGRQGRLPAPDFEWESAWIQYLDRTGEAATAQAVRWVSFERTLDIDRAKAFAARLTDFADVEAEVRAFEHAASHSDFKRGLRFLMSWPALPEAARMIQSRPDEVEADPDEAELWAAKLRRRQPKAAYLLLRRVAASAFRRRDFKTCERLTQEAETIPIFP